MQAILAFDTEGGVKRRKALRACQRCKDAKKRCILVDNSTSCKRCSDDSWCCSFAASTTLDTTAPNQLEHSEGDTPSTSRTAQQERLNSTDAAGIDHTELDFSTSQSLGQSSQFSPSNDRGLRNVPHLTTNAADASGLSPTRLRSGQQFESGHLAEERPPASELRYATMLTLMKKGQQDEGSQTGRNPQPTKLISGTNPLSALLGKELKHKVVTNSCSFRTPDPTVGIQRRTPRRRGIGIHSCDWQQYYRDMGIPEARLRYLNDMNAFKLPHPSRCSELLEIYFSYVHPMMPVVDRGDFLSMFYGGGSPPPLILLHAVFLAASRYATNTGHSSEGISELRSHCDDLHSRLRALIEAEITSERVIVIQAAILASLHWEGREGLNSAIDNLGIAVRACQDLGLHRNQHPDAKVQRRVLLLHRRLWWCLYALDRLNAAQEGTPFLINELDCDVDMLSDDDLAEEEELTRKVTLFNMKLALLIENVVRSLYAPGEDHTTLCTSRGIAMRNRLDLQLEHLAQDIRTTLIPNEDNQMGTNETSDQPLLFGAILATHLDAVRILLHRPFILYAEPRAMGVYSSRDSCRLHASEILSRLHRLLSEDMLRFSWPFTVYAVVNCLLIFWYDLTAPLSQDEAFIQEAKRNYTSVVQLLRAMGTTWWAAAAKYHLAQSLARAADEIHIKQRGEREMSGAAAPMITNSHMQYEGQPLTPLSGTYSQMYVPEGSWLEGDAYAGGSTADYWGSLGLDFDLDVADNIFSISQFATK